MTSRLDILKSDLKDLQNPKFLKRYPHLDKPELVEELKKAIEAEEKRNRTKESNP